MKLLTIIKEKINNTLINLDLNGVSPQLMVNKNKVHKSKFGGLTTILILIIGLYIAQN